MPDLCGPDPTRHLPRGNRIESDSDRTTAQNDLGADSVVAAQPHADPTDPTDDPATERNAALFETDADGSRSADPSPSAGGQRLSESQETVSPGRGSHAASAHWRVTAESVRGTSHHKTGAGCQDSHYVVTAEPGLLIGAVADGAGSAPQSEIGAELAARVAVEELKRWCDLSEPWPETEEQWASVIIRTLDLARAAVESQASTMGLAPRDLASTLIVMLATPDVVVAGQIGDGAVVLLDTFENLIALTAPQSGEYLNETTFLVSPHAIEQVQTSVWRGNVRFLAAFSDGLQMLALRMSDGAAHAPFFAPLFRFLEEQKDLAEAGTQLRSFLTSPRITQRADDDLTLLLAQCIRQP